MSHTWKLSSPGSPDWAITSPTEGGRSLRHGIIQFVPHPLDGPPRTPLAALQALRWMERSLKLERALLIAQARLEGASWSEVADSIGLTKQAAHVQYHKLAADLQQLVSSPAMSEEQLLDYIDAHFDVWMPAPED